MLETWSTHLSLTQCCQVYHLNSGIYPFYPFLCIPTANVLVKTLIPSHLEYSNGLIIGFLASGLALPIFTSIPLLTKLPLPGVMSFPVLSPNPDTPDLQFAQG